MRGRSEPLLVRLGEWVAGLDPGSIPEETRRAAKYQALDMVAAAHAAFDVEGCRAVERAAAGSEGRATVLATGRRLPAADAAYVNAAYSMAHDFDDVVWMGHTCHSCVFAALAVGEEIGASGREALAAIVAANEIAGRLGASSFLGPLNGQMWSFIHLVGAAVATAKLLRLDAERSAQAMAIALAQPNFALQPAFFRPTSKLLTASTPLSAGIRAAFLAREGVTGALDILEAPRGFWSRFSFLALPQMLEGLGQFWTMRTLAVKTFPGCFYFQTACSALAELLARRPGLAAGEVRSVKIATTKLAAEAARFAAEYRGEDEVSPVNVNFDLALTAAVLLHARRFTSRENAAAWLAGNRAQLLALRSKVEVRHEPSLTARALASARTIEAGSRSLSAIGPADLVRLLVRYRREYRSSLLSLEELAGWARELLGGKGGAGRTPGAALLCPSRVELELRGGARESAEVDLPAGTFCAPGFEAEVEAKFVRECRQALGPDRAPAAFSAGLALEDLALRDFAQACARTGP